jgi:hypothetical protein
LSWTPLFLHVGDAEPLHLVADDPAGEILVRSADAGDHAQIRISTGEARIRMSVETETEP